MEPKLLQNQNVILKMLEVKKHNTNTASNWIRWSSQRNSIQFPSQYFEGASSLYCNKMTKYPY